MLRIISLDEIRERISLRDVREAVRIAFVAYAEGRATLPPPINLNVEDAGEVHVKIGHISGLDSVAVKIATGYYGNFAKGLPTSSGGIVVLSALTGELKAFIIDDGYLTELRTAAAGALTIDVLAKRAINRVGVIGSGVQARFQIESLLEVRTPAEIVVFSRSVERLAKFIEVLAPRIRVPLRAVSSAREAVEGSDIVVTVTPTTEPIVKAAWVEPGTHITAVGSDGPLKHELEVEVLAKADLIVADDIRQCSTLGELHHALEAGVELRNSPIALGDVLIGTFNGRGSDSQITIADLTGLGIQDAAIADLAIHAVAG